PALPRRARSRPRPCWPWRCRFPRAIQGGRLDHHGPGPAWPRNPSPRGASRGPRGSFRRLLQEFGDAHAAGEEVFHEAGFDGQKLVEGSPFLVQQFGKDVDALLDNVLLLRWRDWELKRIHVLVVDLRNPRVVANS